MDSREGFSDAIFDLKRRVMNELVISGGKIVCCKSGISITGKIETSNASDDSTNLSKT